MKSIHLDTFLLCVMLTALLASCSSVALVPEDDHLYTGIDKIEYPDFRKSDHAFLTRKEIEAALACKPNGSLFGSSGHRSPFPVSLWIYNAFSNSSKPWQRWLSKTFGKAPVLMSQVNPQLRSVVAQSVLHAHGYFRGTVGHDVRPMGNPRKQKVAYTVDMGPLFTVDTISYTNYPPEADSIIHAHESERLIVKESPFDVSLLDRERIRISRLLRDNGYYYFQPSYSTYLADTLQNEGKAGLKLRMLDSLPDVAQRKWYIGKIDINLRREFAEELHQITRRRRYVVHHNGKRTPVRMKVIMRDVKFRPGDIYSYDKYVESMEKLAGKGLFNMVDFQFTPRDSSATCDSLDLMINCVFDKPYDFYVEANATGKTNGLLGPGLTLGLAKRNAFRGGEKVEFNVHGSYEWQTGHDIEGTSTQINTYEYGGDASVEFPRLLLPFVRRKRFFVTPSTTLKGSLNIVNRAHYFRRHVISGEWTYRIQTSETSRHQFSPLILEYNYMNAMTDEFKEILDATPYLKTAMMDQFIPKLSYTYTYASPAKAASPVSWETTVSESANLLSLSYAVFGEKWSDKEKTMFKNPYAQFFKIETDLRKTWSLGQSSQIVGHLNIGVAYAYGNSTAIPYSEQFYVGGANSIRAFNVRSVGPGAYRLAEKKNAYMDRTGDVKLLANLEYRTKLFGNLHGALFFDAGNVWTVHDDPYRPQGQFRFDEFAQQLAVGTGIGLRYDLEFFVLRLDWGIGLHLPYETGKKGFYNIPSFKDGQSFHLAVGYPF